MLQIKSTFAGEDPYLTGQFGIAYTVGLQTGKLDPRYLQAVVTLKHWDAYLMKKKTKGFNFRKTERDGWGAGIL
jgi:hypothetical protein